MIDGTVTGYDLAGDADLPRLIQQVERSTAPVLRTLSRQATAFTAVSLATAHLEDPDVTVEEVAAFLLPDAVDEISLRPCHSLRAQAEDLARRAHHVINSSRTWLTTSAAPPLDCTMRVALLPDGGAGNRIVVVARQADYHQVFHDLLGGLNPTYPDLAAAAIDSSWQESLQALREPEALLTWIRTWPPTVTSTMEDLWPEHSLTRLREDVEIFMGRHADQGLRVEEIRDALGGPPLPRRAEMDAR